MLHFVNITLLSTGTLLFPVLCILSKFFHRLLILKNLPWLFHKNGWFAQMVKHFKGVDPTPFIKDGYTQVCEPSCIEIGPSHKLNRFE
jgi:hypothetical protein